MEFSNIDLSANVNAIKLDFSKAR